MMLTPTFTKLEKHSPRLGHLCDLVILENVAVLPSVEGCSYKSNMDPRSLEPLEDDWISRHYTHTPKRSPFIEEMLKEQNFRPLHFTITLHLSSHNFATSLGSCRATKVMSTLHPENTIQNPSRVVTEYSLNANFIHLLMLCRFPPSFVIAGLSYNKCNKCRSKNL